MAAVALVEEVERPPLMDDAMQLQPKEERYPVKVRKPYTITKQREKWTEQEHDKFLEALKLYGRSWRQIQEHIGTKTAVQIRSHAQKFFSKVVREPGAGHVIDIPPPRPKRKPLHPYPRKCANPDTLPNQASSQPKLAPVSPPSSDKENGSPVSVLSALQSDASGSSVSNPSMGCTSPMSSDEMVNREQVVPPKQTEIDTSPKEMTQDDSDGDLSEEETLRETSLKLFGKTVIIPDPKKVCTSDGGGGGCEDDEKHTQEMFQASSSDGGVATYAAPNGWLLPHHSFPFQKGESGDAGICPLHFWWPYYGFQVSHPGGLCAGIHGEGTGESDTGKSPSAEPSSGNVQTVTPAACEVVKDSFGTPDSALSFDLKPSVNSAFVPVKPSRSGSQSSRGFVPYKRCKVE